MEYVIKQIESDEKIVEISVTPGLCFSAAQNDLYRTSLLYKFESGLARVEKQYKTTDRKKAFSAFYRYKKEL